LSCFARSLDMRALFAIGLFLAASLQVHAQDLHGYTEPQFGTSALVPQGWRAEPIRDQAGVSGHYFQSPDGQSWIAIFGRPIRRGVNARSSAIGPDERLTYRADGDSWFVRSGLRNDRIFYRKALLSCGGRVAHLMAFDYPANRKLDHDRLVTVMSRSLRSAGAC
jgi:hypothetical protein